MASFVPHQLKFSGTGQEFGCIYHLVGLNIYIRLTFGKGFHTLLTTIHIANVSHPPICMMFIRSHQTELKNSINYNFLSLLVIEYNLYLNSLWLGEGEGGCWWWHCHTAGEKFLLYHDFTGVACGSWDTWWWYSCHTGEHFPDYLTVSWLLTKLAVFEFVFYQGDSEILNATYLVVWYSIIKLQWAVALVAVAVQVNRC